LAKESTSKRVQGKKSGVKRERPVEEINPIDLFNIEMEEKEPDIIYGLYGGENHSLGVVNTLYTGLPSLERALARRRDTNIYGTPLNKIAEVFGKEASGKTTYIKHLCASFIKAGGLSYFVDFEKKFDPEWLRTIATSMGVSEDVLKKRFRYIDPEHFEDFLGWLIRFMKKIIEKKTIARKAILELEKKKKKPDNYEEQIANYRRIIDVPIFIGVDSIAAISTAHEVDKDEDVDIYVGAISKVFTRVLKTIRYYLGYTNMLLMFTNQIRDRIEMNTFIAKRMTSKIRTNGGNAVKHYSDFRIQMIQAGKVARTRKGSENTIGTVHKFKICKNQMGPPPFSIDPEIRMLYDRGYSTFDSVLDCLVAVGKIRKDGSYYFLKKGGETVKIHKNETDEFLAENPKFEEFLHTVYKNHMGDR